MFEWLGVGIVVCGPGIALVVWFCILEAQAAVLEEQATKRKRRGKRDYAQRRADD